MKKRNTVLLLGIISIIILTSVQVFIIYGIWQQKNEMFSLRYTIRSQEALSFINRRLSTDGFDTVRFVLSKRSEQASKELVEITDSASLSRKKQEILKYFTIALNEEQDLSGLLANYFERRNWEKKFVYSIVINDLDIISEDTIAIIHRQDSRARRRIETETKGSFQETSGSILVNWFGMEDNYYRLRFEYFIDFSDKQKLILKESAAILAMSIFSIIVVVTLFVITYRNLKEEKRLSDLKTDFINNITHELKTPLSTITVAGKTLEMAQIRTNEEKILETARLIGKQSVHLNQLINMILEISMWERTEFEIDKKNIDIGDLLNDIIDSFRAGGGNNATINKIYNFDGLKAEVDVVYFTTMINNLLANAVKYSVKEPVIDVDGSHSENNLYIRISDNGIGISKIDQKHIFDKFYRASAGNIHKFKGLGLGLYYVKRIAEAHGGDVNVNSRPGRGSTFTINIPY
ncbi:MAG TPA: HAMP domain-containing sensor histidine kinase [Bacteroidales bacterium]|nr:HAMP domain-containing sensor histidine kinase [Bacteroidales bacterium]